MPLDQSFSRSAHASRTRSTKSASRAISPEIVNVNREVTGDVLASVLGFQSAYSDLRRLVGLVAGMLLLSQTSGKSNAMDWSTLAGARETWTEAETRIRALKPPPLVERNLHHLERAHQLIGNCLDVLRSPRKISNEMGSSGRVAKCGRVIPPFAVCLIAWSRHHHGRFQPRLLRWSLPIRIAK
jgi:hypothetical protein